MAGASQDLHESREVLSTDAVDKHRALVSLQEELEAVDWYNQRAEAATDAELADILRHNRNEEMEHAIMVLEWFRRRSPEMDQQMKTYLFSDAPILQVEEGAMTGGEEAGESVPKEGSLGIGSLRARS